MKLIPESIIKKAIKEHGETLNAAGAAIWEYNKGIIDAIYEYIELGAEYFTPAAEDMLNDAFLGLSVVALGLVAWLVILLVKDPKGVVKEKLTKHKN